MVTEKVNEVLNRMLDAEAGELAGAARYERSGGRKAYRAGHYERDLTVKAGKLSVRVPRLKGALFGSVVIERHRRREGSVEEALIDMVPAGVSTRRVDDTGRTLCVGGNAVPDPVYLVKSVFRFLSGIFFGFMQGACGRWFIVWFCRT
jgi:transposase-like protein